jgi:cellular nucleic acid-binding protein
LLFLLNSLLTFSVTEAGHLSRDCPEPPKSKACYRCGETGHLSRECPQQDGGQPQGTGMRTNDCYKCSYLTTFVLTLGGKIGHIARNCPMNEGGYGVRLDYNDTAKTCYACGGYGKVVFRFCLITGHMAKDCTQGQKCYNCGRLGHVSRDCDQAAQAKVCYR